MLLLTSRGEILLDPGPDNLLSNSELGCWNMVSPLLSCGADNGEGKLPSPCFANEGVKQVLTPFYPLRVMPLRGGHARVTE